MNGSGTTADTNVVFNTSVATTNSTIQDGSTVTLTKESTRPQSVWYTVSASGTVGDAAGTPATQKLYDLTQDESNNIFAVSTGKIPGAIQGGQGGYGFGMGRGDNSSSYNKPTNIYTTIVSGHVTTDSNNTQFGNPFAEPNKGNLQTNNTASAIALSQNYLPLGITANVKDAYFNHNGII